MNRIVGVLDWGALAVADPACDLMIAWTLLAGKSRAAFKDALACDDATWNRARGWTLSVAAIAIPYYLTTNPSIVQWATHAIEEVLGDATT
jgi:aminoglycoside phosphotransferase (APT) family kinase protein